MDDGSFNENDWENTTFHHNHLNTVTALTAHDGAVEEINRFDAFGAPLQSVNDNKLLFTGREYDPIQAVYYYRARYYDPEIGRFVSEDPLGFQAGINFYAYVNNNPVNFTDPSGKIAPVVPLITGAIGAVFGTAGSAAGQIFNNGGFDNFDFSDLAVAGGVGFVAGAAAPFTALTFVGAGLTGAAANSGQFLISEAFNGNFNDITLGDVAISGATGFAGGLIGGPFTRNTGLHFDEASPFLQNARSNNIFDDLSGNVGTGSFARNALGATFTNLDLDISLFDTTPTTNLFGGNSASGGFVLYPSKPNTNVIRAVYKK